MLAPEIKTDVMGSPLVPDSRLALSRWHEIIGIGSVPASGIRSLSLIGLLSFPIVDRESTPKGENCDGVETGHDRRGRSEAPERSRAGRIHHATSSGQTGHPIPHAL